MADFISREAAYKTLTEYYHHSSGVQHTVLREALNRVPTADVRPVVRGKWEIADSYAGPGLINLRCSVCGAFGGTWKDNTIPSMLPKFCHECGTDMRETGR